MLNKKIYSMILFVFVSFSALVLAEPIDADPLTALPPGTRLIATQAINIPGNLKFVAFSNGKRVGNWRNLSDGTPVCGFFRVTPPAEDQVIAKGTELILEGNPWIVKIGWSSDGTYEPIGDPISFARISLKGKKSFIVCGTVNTYYRKFIEDGFQFQTDIGEFRSTFGNLFELDLPQAGVFE